MERDDTKIKLRLFMLFGIIILMSVFLESCDCSKVDCDPNSDIIELTIKVDNELLFRNSEANVKVQLANGILQLNEEAKVIVLRDTVVIISLTSNEEVNLTINNVHVGELELFTNLVNEGRCCNEFETDRITLNGMTVCELNCSELIELNL